MMAKKLTDSERATALTPLFQAGWALHETRDALVKRFVFDDFTSAFGWMTQVAICAEKLNHHPEWFNVYKSVDVVLTTHDVTGLSDFDIQIAQMMDFYAK